MCHFFRILRALHNVGTEEVAQCMYECVEILKKKVNNNNNNNNNKYVVLTTPMLFLQ